MHSISSQLRVLIAAARPRLLSVSDARASEKPYAGTWSLKEVLGHLVDSAANNHQRIVRMQQQSDIGTFTYDQESWNAIQKYHAARWSDLVELWASFNTHLAHVVEHVDATSLGNICDMGYDQPATLKFVIEDYLRHVQHHLDQIFGDADPRQRTRWKRRNPRED